LRRALSFGVLASIGPALWLLRNARTPEGALGLRVRSNESVGGIAKDVGHAVVHLLAPDSLANSRAVALTVGLALLALFLAMTNRRALRSSVDARGPSAVPMVAFIIVYLILVTAARKTTGSDVTPRILLPALLLGIVLGAGFFERLLLGTDHRSRFVALAAIAAVGLVGLSAYWVADQVRVGAKPSAALFHYPQPDPATRKALAQVAPTALVVSNDPWRVYNATGHQPVKLAPMPVQPGFSHRPISVDDLARAVTSGPVPLVWFARSPASDTRSVAGLPGQDRYVLDSPRSFPGGVEYTLRVRARSRPNARA
jgi:hypothetical protein